MIKYNKGHSFNHFGIKRIQLTSPEYFWWYKLRIPWCFAASKKPERNKRIKGVMFCQNIIYNWWSPYHELSTSGYICTKYSTKNTRVMNVYHLLKSGFYDNQKKCVALAINMIPSLTKSWMRLLFFNVLGGILMQFAFGPGQYQENICTTINHAFSLDSYPVSYPVLFCINKDIFKEKQCIYSLL